MNTSQMHSLWLVIVMVSFLMMCAPELAMSESRSSTRSLRCNGDLIQVGDSQYKISSKCGEPDFKTTSYEMQYVRKPGTYILRKRDGDFERQPFLVKKQVEIEEWTYNFGPNRFMYYLIFEDDVLAEIEMGDYGFHD